MKRQISVPLLLLLLVTLGFRIVHLEADPPADFSWSGGYFADEGFWSHNARNAALFQAPVRDEWDARIVSPVFARLQEAIFRVFGAGFVQVRIIAVISSLLLAAASFALFRTQLDGQVSFLFAVLVSFNYPMMVLGRQGILDPFAAALCLIAMVCLLQDKQLLGFIAGVLFVTACATKYLMVYAAFPFAYVLWKSKQSLWFLAGAIGAILVWFFVNYLPHKELLHAYNAYYASQQSWHPVALLKNVVTQPYYLYFAKTPAILCFANLAMWFGIGIAMNRSARGITAAGHLEKICFVWLVSGVLFFALWKYRPFRYYTSLIPPTAALATFVLFRLKDVSQAIQIRNVRILIFLGLLLPVAQLGFLLVDRFAEWNVFPRELGIHSIEASLVMLLSLVLVWSLRAGGTKLKYATWAFVAVFLLSDLRNYLGWVLKPDYNAVQISRDLQVRAPGAVITGQWAPELCLDNNLRVVPVWHGFVNSNKPFEKFNITHLLQWKYSLGGEKFEEWYPENFKEFQFVTKYRIKDSDLILYERKRIQENQNE